MDMQQTINPGATVYGADGEKVGTVATYGGSYIVVEKGFFFPKGLLHPTRRHHRDQRATRSICRSPKMRRSIRGGTSSRVES